MEHEKRIQKKQDTTEKAEPSVFTCPDCHGALWKVDENGLTHFRCRIGHIYSMDSLVEGQRESVERAMWAAVRSLEEDAELADRMYRTAKDADRARTAERYLKRTEASRQNADVIRGILLKDMGPPAEGIYVDESAEKADDSAA